MRSTFRDRGHAAFTLVELLSVMAVISVVIALGVPALKGLAGASGLNGAGNEVDGLLTSARQNSITKGVLTAVVVLGNPANGSSDASFRTMTLLQLAPTASGAAPSSGNWTQIERWHVLATGTVIDNGSDGSTPRSSFLAANSISPALPALNYASTRFQPAGGAASPGYFYQVFMPDGRLYQPPSPCTLQLTQGYYSGGTFTYTGTRNNYYKFICTDATGELKIIRP